LTPTASLRDLTLEPRYSSGRNNLIGEFFAPCLEAATSYDRAVGFFSSSFYTLVEVPIAEFARAGGKFRIVCSPRLTAEDIAAIDAGYEQRAAGEAVVRELEEHLDGDPAGDAAARLLATLIAGGTVEIRLAFRPDGAGLFHDKVGIFADADGNRVTFTGSANETWAAWSGRANHEYFHAFASWREHDAGRVREDAEYFEALWAGSEPELIVLDFPAVARERLEQVADPGGPAAAAERLRSVRAGGAPRPTLRPHQRAAVEQWTAAGQRGILEHATGSGKTVTAMTCIERALLAGKSALVLVPSLALSRQWSGELRAFFGDRIDLLRVSGEDTQWRRGSLLRDFLNPSGRRQPVVLATMDTAASDEFVERVRDLPDLLLVADEVHRIGSPQRRNTLRIEGEWRLGLSATWEREGDAGGSEAILAYFERVLEPPYTLADAIRDGYLCKYQYMVHPLQLDDEERERWEELTTKLSRLIAAADGEMTESAKQLAIKRRRIVKGARAKVPMAVDLLAEKFAPGKAWLVYCDDSEQLAEMKRACLERDLHCFEYHTKMSGDGLAALREFERGGGIMLSINCLDEGVDIPRISHALILASSTSRREFIQRRGRVLRKHESKHVAVVHDAFVDAGGFEDPHTARFVEGELKRAWEFAASAIDSEATKVMLARAAEEVGISLDLDAATETVDDANEVGA
jgi:superfamily II DNA or RNA helicase